VKIFQELNMKTTDLTERRVAAEVDRQFRENPPVPGQHCVNPVTGASYVGGRDPAALQKKQARRALLARERFRREGPADAPELPLSHGEREDLKVGGLSTLVALYARSWEAQDYDEEHPTFQEYACGAMASEFMGYRGIKEDAQLLKDYPPRHLAGLGPGLYWEPTKEHARTMESYRRSLPRERRATVMAG
jgi:hypothetical protein